MPAPPGAPTVLLYAHHDVQPPGPASLWDGDPFAPLEQDGRLYGRGSSDDKSGIVSHYGALLAHGGRPPVGVKVFVEGEEEIGSPNLPAFLAAYSDLLAADVIVIADSGNCRTGQPTLTTSLRGLADYVIEVQTLEFGVHSGGFGGALPDALTVLSRTLATLHDDQGRVAIAGLVSEDADPLDLTEAEFRHEAGAVDSVELIGEGTITSRLWTRPAVAVLAIDAPRVQEAINQLVPSARAKVSLRLGPGDDPDRAMDALSAHLEANVPWGAKVTVTRGSGGEPFSLDTTSRAYDAFRVALELGYGKPSVEVGGGGSIPFVAALSHAYPDASILLTGAGDPLSRAHGPNESVDLADLESSTLAEAIALHLLAE